MARFSKQEMNDIGPLAVQFLPKLHGRSVDTVLSFVVWIRIWNYVYKSVPTSAIASNYQSGCHTCLWQCLSAVQQSNNQHKMFLCRAVSSTRGDHTSAMSTHSDLQLLPYIWALLLSTISFSMWAANTYACIHYWCFYGLVLSTIRFW